MLPIDLLVFPGSLQYLDGAHSVRYTLARTPSTAHGEHWHAIVERKSKRKNVLFHRTHAPCCSAPHIRLSYRHPSIRPSPVWRTQPTEPEPIVCNQIFVHDNDRLHDECVCVCVCWRGNEPGCVCIRWKTLSFRRCMLTGAQIRFFRTDQIVEGFHTF